MKNNLLSFLVATLYAVVFAFLIGASFGSGYALPAAIVSFIALRFMQSPRHVLGLNNTNNLSARAAFEQAKVMFYKAFRNNFPATMDGDRACKQYVESLKLSQNEIRVEVNLTTTASNFLFGLTPNQANTSNVQFLTENRLNLQDTLCVNEHGIFVAQTTGNNDAAYEFHTYGNTQAFAAADALALNSTFYKNGQLVIKCNNDVIVPGRGLYNHFYSPQTQQTGPLGAGSPGDQLRGAEDGFITDDPNIVLVGSKNYQIEVQLKAAMASAAANLRCILILRGVLAQNSTVVS